MDAAKIVKSVPLAKRIIQANAISFSVDSTNGFFLSVMGNKILEFDKLEDAQTAATTMNQVIDPIKKSYIADYEKKIDEILNA